MFAQRAPLDASELNTIRSDFQSTRKPLPTTPKAWFQRTPLIIALLLHVAVIAGALLVSTPPLPKPPETIKAIWIKPPPPPTVPEVVPPTEVMPADILPEPIVSTGSPQVPVPAPAEAAKAKAAADKAEAEKAAKAKAAAEKAEAEKTAKETAKAKAAAEKADALKAEKEAAKAKAAADKAAADKAAKAATEKAAADKAAKAKAALQKNLGGEDEFSGLKKDLSDKASAKAAADAAAEKSRNAAAMIAQYKNRIQQTVKNRWKVPAGTEKHKVTVRISLNASGEVQSAVLTQSSGDDALDASIKAAILGGQLPVPDDPEIFQKHFRLLTLSFSPE